MLKWSIFLVKVCANNKVLLYHTLNGAVSILESYEYKQVGKSLSSSKTILSSKDKQVLKELEDNKFLVPKSFDEKKYFIDLLDKEIEENKHFTMHILPTTACNFNCPYCYQSGIDRAKSLSPEKEELIVKYVKKFLKGKDMEEATVVIHGGEPTIAWSSVERLMPKLKKIFDSNGIVFRTQIVSNGYELTSEKSDFLSKYNWQRFQVTIDGPKSTHDKRRILRNGAGSFDKIIENITYAFDKNRIEKVSIRVNFDMGNSSEIPELLLYLSKKFDVSRITLSLGFISKTVEDTDANEYIAKYGIKLEDLKKEYLKLYKEAYSLGFDMPELFMFDGMCTAKLKNSFVISSDGSVFKCLSGVGRSNFCIGNIDTLGIDLPDYFFKELYTDCLDKNCEFLPLCNTGCRFNAYLKNGNIRSIDCRRDYLLDINKEILKFRYLSD
ncbi:MAG: radical SAM protein [Candidatus Dojkabacteria bacterium]|jgi:uncharacterized protein